VFEQDTYEAESPGDLAVIVAQLHDLVDEDYGSVSDLLKESLNHVTFRHDVDRIQSSGLYELLEVNPTNIGTGEYALFNYAFSMAKTKQIIRSMLRSPIRTTSPSSSMLRSPYVFSSSARAAPCSNILSCSISTPACSGSARS
jgi:hypothetical protein